MINDDLAQFGRVADVERLYGLKRSTLYALISEGKVRSRILRRKRKANGIRLIDQSKTSDQVWLLNSLARRVNIRSAIQFQSWQRRIRRARELESQARVGLKFARGRRIVL